MTEPITDQEARSAASSQIRLLLLACVAIIVVLAAAAIALYQKIDALERRVSRMQASVADLNARIERTSVVAGGTATGIVGLLREQEKTGAALARIEAAATAKPPAPEPSIVVLTADHLTGLRSQFNLTAAPGSAQYRLGDQVPADSLKPLPAEVVDRTAPQLKGARYLIDRNGALVVAAGADNRVVLVVAPD